MNSKTFIRPLALAVAIGSLPLAAGATEPCGDFGECKVLVEINATDGDIGFHFLMDGHKLRAAALFNPLHQRIFGYVTRRELRQQYLTETFAESEEPLCYDPTLDDDPENDDEDFVTLEDFLDRWHAGTYKFFGVGADWELSFGSSELTFNLPAAPTDLEYAAEVDDDDVEGEITWSPGDDLGECSDGMELLPVAPGNVPVAAWEVVVEPDVEGPLSAFTYVVRIPGDVAELEVEVPDDYLETLPPNTPVKIEVGAIGFGDNATFSEQDGICVNETEENGCGFEEEE
ncbi:MAG TPA: hypothetical protein VFY03_06725 [Woeseiaceae bacterium]|nr:hypothetical protein [Woeseiaceae bacterium]